jgi:hypothetical protein
LGVSVILGGIVAVATAVPSKPSTDDRSRVVPAAIRSVTVAQPVTVVRFDTDGWVQQIDRRGLVALNDPGSTIRLDTDTGRCAIRGTAPVHHLASVEREPTRRDQRRRPERRGACRDTQRDEQVEM